MNSGEAVFEEEEDPPKTAVLPPVVFPAGGFVPVSLEASGDSLAIGVLLSIGRVASLKGVGVGDGLTALVSVFLSSGRFVTGVFAASSTMAVFVSALLSSGLVTVVSFLWQAPAKNATPTSKQTYCFIERW